MKLFILALFCNLVLAGTTVIPDKDMAGNVITRSDSFASKHNYNFRGTGMMCMTAASSMTTCQFTITYNHVKFNGLRVIGAVIGDKVNLKVKDTVAGTYSTVPNAILNQFGFNWYLAKDQHTEILPYASDLYIGMIIVIEYTSVSTSSNNVYFNYYMHEQP